MLAENKIDVDVNSIKINFVIIIIAYYRQGPTIITYGMMKTKMTVWSSI